MIFKGGMRDAIFCTDPDMYAYTTRSRTTIWHGYAHGEGVLLESVTPSFQGVGPQHPRHIFGTTAYSIRFDSDQIWSITYFTWGHF